MSEDNWLLTSLVLFLVSLPLLSIGTDQDISPLWAAGLVLVALAGVIPFTLRFVSPDDGGDKDG
ncbi:hypothetical protein ACFU5N_17440 [Streptomyces albidoflavus]